MIEKQAPDLIPICKGRSLTGLSFGVTGNTDLENMVIDTAIRNLDILSPRELAEIIKNIPSPRLLDVMLNENKIMIDNDLDLLFYVKSVSDPKGLQYLETKFCELNNFSNNQSLLGILFEFTNKNYILKDHTISFIEEKLISPENHINIKDLNHILRLFNHRTLYRKGSPNF